MTILFYGSKSKPYGCFSNFSPHGFELDGVWWPTSEHYFQAQKFAGTPFADIVRQTPTPNEAAKMGRRRSLLLRQDWNEVKDQVMLQGVLRKFENHADIRAILLATGDETLVENAPRDYYWGYGADGSGQNKLGQVLMQVRMLLRNTIGMEGDRKGQCHSNKENLSIYGRARIHRIERAFAFI